MTKPFSPRELVARIKAILRRTASPARPPDGSPVEQVLRIRDVVIDREEYTVTVHGRSVKLSATEFKLLLYLAERPKKIFSRDICSTRCGEMMCMSSPELLMSMSAVCGRRSRATRMSPAISRRCAASAIFLKGRFAP